MVARVAVAVIHGIASRPEPRPASSTDLGFSRALYRRLASQIGKRRLKTEVAWREIFWADVLADRQEAYLARIGPRTRYQSIRNFIVTGIGDAAAYQPREGDADTAYAKVQARVGDVIAELDADVGPDTPLVILAHSFGSWIISSYIWDMQAAKGQGGTDFQRMKTLSRFITFGSNLPLFTFAYPPDAIHPISCPGSHAVQPWWLNYYDRDDVLGYPIGPIAPRYEQMVARGELADIEIDAGSFFTAWNPLSHERYWTDRDFTRPVADVLRGLLGVR